jgi:methionyl-tRNA formyltransferase
MSSSSNTNPRRFVVVGAGKTAIDIVQILATDNRAIVTATLGDGRGETAQSSMSVEAHKLGIPHLQTRSLSDAQSLEFMRSAAPDYVISANNFLLFREAALAIPKLATVNFHNGPLPQYAGLNPFCWAILNGETHYGITWHLVDTGIDSGRVLHVERFDLGAKPTAVGTLIKCIREGIKSFRETVLPRLVDTNLTTTSQDAALRQYYSGKDKPYGGLLPWWESADVLEPLSRSIRFAPLANLFYRPELHCADGRRFFCERIDVSVSDAAKPPGTITNITPTAIGLATPDGVVTALGLYAENGDRIAPSDFGLAIGQVLVRPEA